MNLRGLVRTIRCSNPRGIDVKSLKYFRSRIEFVVGCKWRKMKWKLNTNPVVVNPNWEVASHAPLQRHRTRKCISPLVHVTDLLFDHPPIFCHEMPFLIHPTMLELSEETYSPKILVICISGEKNTTLRVAQFGVKNLDLPRRLKLTLNSLEMWLSNAILYLVMLLFWLRSSLKICRHIEYHKWSRDTP